MTAQEQLFKKCTVCGERKPATLKYFYPQKTGKDGFRSPCKQCIRTGQAKPIKIKPVDYTKRNEKIYRTYYKTACDNPMKQHMLAKFFNITKTELTQIIKTEDEKQMKLKWTDEMNNELIANASLPGASNGSLAQMYGTSVANIAWRLTMLRKAAKKPPANDPTPLEVIDPVNTYADTDIDPKNPPRPVPYVEPTALRMDPDKVVNAKIASLCETPDPLPIHKAATALKEATESIKKYFGTPKIDYTESLIETLREAEEFREPVYFVTEPQEPKPAPAPKQRTVFDEAHAVLWSLESMAKRNGIEVSILTLKVDNRIIADASDFMGLDAVCINKKRQPTAGTAD